MALNAPGWLVARPIAHRGLHDERAGVIENTLEAAHAAIARGYGIECDAQPSADGEAVVFHDSSLERLTSANGPAAGRTARELAAIAFKASPLARIPTFRALLDAVAGRTPIVCELKSGFDGDMRLAGIILALARDYSGPLALKSFDPAVIAWLRAEGAPCPLGIVAQADYDDCWPELSPRQRLECANFLHYGRTRPDFLSFCVDDLPHPAPALMRAIDATPVMAWTVRTRAQKDKAREWADQIVFEGEIAD